MATLEELQAQRQTILAEIKKRGGKESAPGYVKRLEAVESQIRSARGGKPAAASQPLPVGKNGRINPVAAPKQVYESELDDTAKTFDMMNPSYTDLGGNTRNVTRNPDGTVSVNESRGAGGAAFDAFMRTALGGVSAPNFDGAPGILTDNDLMATRQGAFDTLYSQGTKNLDRNKAREREDLQQELANRGIPYEPGADPEKSAYARAMRDLDERYDARYDDAELAANAGADARLSTLSGINATARDAFMNSALAKSNWGLDAAGKAAGTMSTAYSSSLPGYAGGSQNTTDNLLALINSASDAELARYGISSDMKVKLRQLAMQGRGGGSSSNNDPIIGGAAPGFGV